MGKLIVFEGIDGAGKATQVKLLAAKLRREKKKVSVFNSPRYDLPTGKIVWRALHGAYGNFIGLDPHISMLPYLLDFNTWREEVVAALKEGDVICDRYIHSTVAFHAAKLSGKKRKEFVREVERLAFGPLRLPRPTRVIYLDVSVDGAATLLRGKKQDQHEKDRSYQRAVRETYRSLAERANWRTVECTARGGVRSPDAIHTDVLRAVQ